MVVLINLMKPRFKRGLTTGDVSKILGISRSTAARFFDQGILTGWEEPVTGWRVIDLESVTALAEKSGVELPPNEQMEKDLKSLKRKRTWAVIPATQKKGRDTGG
jgi:hypothetical protein